MVIRQHTWLLILSLALIGVIGQNWWGQRKPRFDFPVEGKASWYSRTSPGIRPTTANNEKFDDTAITCAMWDVRFNRRVRVTNTANGKSVECRVNDRGPHPRFVREGRVIDLTLAAFREIGAPKKGMVPVRVELLPEPEQ